MAPLQYFQLRVIFWRNKIDSSKKRFFIASYLFGALMLFSHFTANILLNYICVANKISLFLFLGDTICNNEFIVIQLSYTSKKPFIDITDTQRAREIRYIFIRLFMCHFCFYIFIQKHGCQLSNVLRCEMTHDNWREQQFICLRSTSFYLWLTEMSSIIYIYMR